MRFVVATDTPHREPFASRPRPAVERRAHARFSLGEAFGHMNHHGTMIPCRFVNISLGGCRVRTETPFAPGALEPVEIVLLVFGLGLRVDGETQWTRACDIGIRFTYNSIRSKNQLASLLTCLMDKDAKQAVEEIFSQAALDPATSPTVFVPSARRQPAPTPVNPVPANPVPASPVKDTPPPDLPQATQVSPAHASPVQPSSAASSAAPPSARPETALPHRSLEPLIATEDQWPTLIRFLRDRTHTQGIITGLNLQACAVKTAQPFTEAIGSPVEMSFQIRGLPFQLRGSVAETIGKHSAQIRFLELSRRKCEELQQVLDELNDAAAKKK
jgi:hypothetical protein